MCEVCEEFEEMKTEYFLLDFDKETLYNKEVCEVLVNRLKSVGLL